MALEDILVYASNELGEVSVSEVRRAYQKFLEKWCLLGLIGGLCDQRGRIRLPSHPWCDLSEGCPKDLTEGNGEKTSRATTFGNTKKKDKFEILRVGGPNDALKML